MSNKVKSVLFFRIGVLLLGIGGILDFIRGMADISDYNNMLRITGSFAGGIVIFILVNLLGIAAAVIAVKLSKTVFKSKTGFAVSLGNALLLLIFSLIGKTASELNGFVLLCIYASKGFILPVVCFVISAVCFAVSYLNERS